MTKSGLSEFWKCAAQLLANHRLIN